MWLPLVVINNDGRAPDDDTMNDRRSMDKDRGNAPPVSVSRRWERDDMSMGGKPCNVWGVRRDACGVGVSALPDTPSAVNDPMFSRGTPTTGCDGFCASFVGVFGSDTMPSSTMCRDVTRAVSLTDPSRDDIPRADATLDDGSRLL